MRHSSRYDLSCHHPVWPAGSEGCPSRVRCASSPPAEQREAERAAEERRARQLPGPTSRSDELFPHGVIHYGLPSGRPIARPQPADAGGARQDHRRRAAHVFIARRRAVGVAPRRKCRGARWQAPRALPVTASGSQRPQHTAMP